MGSGVWCWGREGYVELYARMVCGEWREEAWQARSGRGACLLEKNGEKRRRYAATVRAGEAWFARVSAGGATGKGHTQGEAQGLGKGRARVGQGQGK